VCVDLGICILQSNQWFVFGGTPAAALLNYAREAGEAGKAGDGNTAAFTEGAAAKMTRAFR